MEYICDGAGEVTIHRFFCPSSRIERGLVYLRGNEGYHLAKILRAKAGQKVQVFTEREKEFLGKVSSVRGREVVIEILESVEHKVEPTIRIDLAQAIVKASKMDILIQKCTEIGAWSFTPLITERSVKRPNQPEKQLERWDRIALEAVKQSERRHIPPVYGIKKLEEFLVAVSGSRRIYLDARAGEPTKSIFQELAKVPDDSCVTVMVGPEGGFSNKERIAIQNAGFLPVNLGPRVLRTETAASVILALLIHEFSDF